MHFNSQTNIFLYTCFVHFIAFVFLLLLMEPIYLWYQIFTIKCNSKIPYASFSIIPAIEYIIGISYFKTNHFDDKMKQIRSSTLTYFNEERRILSFFVLLCCLIGSGIVMYIDVFVIYWNGIC